ncbi:MAG: ABC transporter substrate-binding protein [Deltaproteobacteria bacterium]|nr:ABC transporter substrate-binding protein [Deltaproteobacteria bacterium]
MRLVCRLSLLVLLTLALGNPAEAGEALQKMTVGQAGVNPGAGLFAIAVNQGLYKKHGLDVEIIKTNTTAAVQAMLANKMQMATGAGMAAFITAQLEGAPGFTLVGSWVNTFPYKIMAQKGIKKVEDLKGKTGHVGAPFGTIPDTALRFALNRLKIDAEKDVKLVQHSNADPASILAAMEKGEVQFGILAPPFDLIAERRGYEMLLALPGLGIPWQQNGEIVPTAYLKSNRDNVVRLMRATAEASKFYFENKEKTVDIMTEYLGRPRNETEYAYNQFKNWTDKNHRPQVETVKTTLEAIKRTTPKAATANAATFVDTSIADQLVKEGYYK